MKILIYGFGPYGEFTDNVTERILSGLPALPEVATKIFDVRFDRRMFESFFEAIQPDIILGLGQHPSSETIREERVARNVMAERGEVPVTIDALAPDTMSMSLRIPSNGQAVETTDAGSYVCNYSMWISESYSRANSGKAAFLHIPPNTDIEAARQYLIDLVTDLRAGSEVSV